MSERIVERLVARFIEVRNELKKLEADFEEKKQPLKDLHNELTVMLQKLLDKHGADSMKTSQGTVSTSVRYTATVQDAESFMAHVIATKQWDLLDRRANSTAVKDYVKDHKVEPPGVKLNALRTLGVTRPRKKAEDTEVTAAVTQDGEATDG